jgi:hypothetical protein
LFIPFFEKDIGSWVLVASMVAIAIGYWFLAVAARRGDPRPLTIVICVFLVALCINVAGQIWLYVQSNGEKQPELLVILLVGAVAAALSINRRNLIELRERGLGSQAFPETKPTNRLCGYGGTMLVVGMLVMFASLLLPAIGAARTAKARHEFVALINGPEHDLLTALNSSEDSSPDKLDRVMSMLAALQSRMKELARDSPSDARLQAVFEDYQDVLERWQRGFTAIKDEGRATQATMDILNDADRRRADTLKAFDELYRPPLAGSRDQ